MFDANVASVYGGGIYVGEGHDTVRVLDASFIQNEASVGGGKCRFVNYAIIPMLMSDVKEPSSSCSLKRWSSCRAH